MFRKKQEKSRDIWREPGRDEQFYIKYLSVGEIGILLISYVFYRNLWFSLPLSAAMLPYFLILKKILKRKKRERFRLQLRDFLQLLSGNLQAGDSMENGLKHTLSELSTQWGKDSFIYRDVEWIVRQITLSHQTVRILTAWGEARKDKELMIFLQVFLYGRQAGGDLCKIIRKTTDSISRRIETKQEIETLLASQRYEQEIMSAMPMGLLLYVGLMNPGYLQVLYNNPGGILFMTICLLLYAVCVVLGLYILRIEVEE